MLRDIAFLAIAAAMLSGCASPPEPVSVTWKKPLTPVNTMLPEWKENNVVVPSSRIDGHWSQYIVQFSPDAVYPPPVWYAVAHSSQVVVSTKDSRDYFAAKSWLRRNGYHGLIIYRSKASSLGFTSAEIFFYR